jgi:hypothetical protein
LREGRAAQKTLRQRLVGLVFSFYFLVLGWLHFVVGRSVENSLLLRRAALKTNLRASFPD